MANVRIKRNEVRDLKIPEHYARNINDKMVKDIVSKFDPNALGVFVTNIRNDGTISLIDGNHRAKALRNMKRGDMIVDCVQFEGLTEAEEAKLFATLNKQLVMHATERFHALVIAGDEDANLIAKMLREHSLNAQKGGKLPNSLQSIDRLYTLLRNGTLEDVLDTVQQAWVPYEWSLPSILLTAIGVLYKRWPSLNKKRLAQALAERDPHRWKNDIRAVQDASGEKRSIKVAVEIIVRAYNHSLNMKNRLRLPPRWKPTLS